jgi:hypothetical protein
VASIRDSEALYEEESLYEDESEEEGIFGTIARGLGSLLGEGEEEDELHEHELEDEAAYEDEAQFEDEDEAAYEDESEEEGIFGAIAQGLGSLLGEGEEEDESLFEDEAAYEDEASLEDEGEFFFKKFGRALRGIARVAAPMVLKAVGGPLGGVLSQAAGSLLSEAEDELEHEDEHEAEAEYEASLMHEVSHAEALAEHMASVAAGAQTEAEAEAMIGAATLSTLSNRERRELQRVLAHLVRGSAILTRLLRRRRLTRPAVRAVPFIVHQTAKTLTRRAAQGAPVTRGTAARVMARHTRRVIGNPHVCRRVIRRNVAATRAARRTIVQPQYGRAVRRPVYARPRATYRPPVYRPPVRRTVAAYRPAVGYRPRRRY